jgi:site-specific DNA recombinase
VVNDAEQSSDIPIANLTFSHIGRIHSGYMALEQARGATAGEQQNAPAMPVVVKAALYARVSTERQREEATIASQVFELKRQIAAAGHELVKEYIDDGYSGAYLDRPALDEMRAAVKTDIYDAVYFLCPDRIARDVVHQNIIISELVLSKKRIIINGKDYEENPENRFALTVFGAVSEFERAKIAERMMRGKMHKLRSGVLVAGGTIYGYKYHRRTPTSAPVLVIDEEQAAIVRFMFEAYGTTAISTAGIARILEERGVKTYRGLLLWERGRIVKILQNPTYTGVRYLNQLAVVHEAPGAVRTTKRKRFVQRSRDEWIGIKVPDIVSQELFDKVQERLRVVRSRYCKLSQTALLTGYVRCADCGRNIGHGYMQSRYRLRTGGTATHERGQYRCSKRSDDSFHHASNRGRCRNTSIATTLLDHTVVNLIRDTMLILRSSRPASRAASTPLRRPTSAGLQAISTR